MKGFKDFVMRGNLVELAVAFIMAAAFAAVVTTFTNWLLSLIPAGATSFGDTKFGLFLTALVSFLVMAHRRTGRLDDNRVQLHEHGIFLWIGIILRPNGRLRKAEPFV